MPIEIPTTVESITGKEIERSINATDAEDALKYFPSLSVRKRYIGDYDHAVLATRASGTGNSARSLVYADGILLSNLLGNGAGFTPRWGLVTPEEIERIDVLYGPFSAAYSGNSAGAIVDFVTRMPTRLEAHAKLQGFVQPSYRLYGTDDSFGGGEASASIGSRAGAFSWWLALNHLTSDAQPVSFVVKNVPATIEHGGNPGDRRVPRSTTPTPTATHIPASASTSSSICAPNTGSPGHGSSRPASTISPTRATGRSIPTRSAPTTPSFASTSDQRCSQRQDLP